MVLRVDYTDASPSTPDHAIAHNAANTQVNTNTASVAAEAVTARAAEALAAQKSANLSDLASVVVARTNLGLGTAATQPSTAFEVAGAATTAQAAAKTAADGSYVTVVNHGAVAGTARPAGVVRVFWVGSVSPTNAATYDRWVDTSTTPYTERIYNGAAFTTFTVPLIATPGGLSATGTPSASTFLRGDGSWTAAPVTSVAGRTGAVVLALADVPGAINAAGAPVQSVAGRTGAVVLTSADISGLTAGGQTVVTKTIAYAAAAGDYVLANGTFTVTIPVLTATQRVSVKNIGTGTVTVAPTSGTIDGAATVPLSIQYTARDLVGDGTNLWVA